MSNALDLRSQHQWELFRLNIIAGGGIIAFAVKIPKDFEYALLIMPIFSTILFLYWIHHAFVIRLESKEYVPPSLNQWEFIRRFTILLAVLGNFVGFPLLSVQLYSRKDYQWLLKLDYICIIVIILLFLIWMYLQYGKKSIK